MSEKDPWAELTEMEQPAADYIDRVTELDRHYGGATLRLECLRLAMTVPDGASPPPLDQVLERAKAYWHFIRKGENLFE